MRGPLWISLGLFAALLLALFLLPLTGASEQSWPGLVNVTILVVILFVSQVTFLAGAGTADLCRPIRKRRLAVPVAVAGGMLAVLAAGMWIGLSELFRLGDSLGLLLLLVVALWILFGFLLWVYSYRVARFRALYRMTTWVFAGSLAELLASIPMHLVVRRRGGCFVGMGTSIGITAGILVMLWAFGPAVVLLMLKNRYHAERTRDKNDLERTQAAATAADQQEII